uniref:regulator of G-protein signaling 4-like isoform X1 n=1 Tax=Doryrhamphus excisus TaxID=161450 RepID=UPI0025ADFBE9|nr:regulator of G-protein signaling 4-like isoform X1 [Doryrhamphus excisus]XP_057929333.1 regulator of G-protein signaling 4-like isoform X1 [Doryrhamphus excisus]
MCKGLATLPATCLKSAKDIKHKLSILLQKQDSQEAAQKQNTQKNEVTAKRQDKRDVKQPQGQDCRPVKDCKGLQEAGVPTAAEVEEWKESFVHVMDSEIGQAVFTHFLRSEFSQENMDFWVACEDFKNTSTCKLVKKAKLIYQQYVAVDAPNEVNLDAVTRQETRLMVETGSLSCFDEAQKRIYLLMEKDSYRRFLKSKLIQDLSQGPDSATRKNLNSDCHSTDIRKG